MSVFAGVGVGFGGCVPLGSVNAGCSGCGLVLGFSAGFLLELDAGLLVGAPVGVAGASGVGLFRDVAGSLNACLARGGSDFSVSVASGE